jgi:hypothetical protein
MRNVICLALLVPILVLAAGRTQPVTALVPESGVMNTAPAATPADQGRVTIPPKALVGTLDTIGGTTYDWWTNGPGLRMITNSPEFGVHALWMNSAATSGTTFDDRNMRYNYYDYSNHAWNWIDPEYMQSGVNVFPTRSGYGNIGADPTSGAAIVGCHYSGTGGVTPKVAKDADHGTGIFDYADGEPVLGICQWAPIAVGQDGQINIFPITAAYALSYSHIAAGNWPTFAAPITPFDPSPGFPTHNIAASKVSSKVALAWDISVAVGGGVVYGYVDFSTDGGATWDGPTELDPPAVFGGDTLTTYDITSMSPWYDGQDKFHLVVNLQPCLNDTEQIIPAEIWHYCPDNDPQWNRIHTAGCDPANLQAAVGYNASYACRPSMGQDNDGNLFVVWEQFDSANVEPGPPTRLRADIFASGSTDNGITWTPAVKLTDAGTSSMRFPSVIDLAVEGNPDPDTIFIIYEVDQIAGFFVQSEGAATNNTVVVQKVPVDLVIVPGVAEQRGATPVRLDAVAKPNPFGARTRISYAVPRAGDVSLVVYDAVGRPVRTLVSGRHEAGRYSATWDAGHAAAGVYFYTLTNGKTSVTRKLILAD